jgi:hypothetical protein
MAVQPVAKTRLLVVEDVLLLLVSLTKSFPPLFSTCSLIHEAVKTATMMAMIHKKAREAKTSGLRASKLNPWAKTSCLHWMAMVGLEQGG